MTEQEAFTTYLRRQRQRTGISLHQIAAATRIRPELLEGLEHNDFHGWPRGLYARAYVRDYATAVGVDPEEAVEEFCRLFPYGDRRAEATMKDMAMIVASDPEWRNEFTHPVDRRRSAEVNLLPKPRGLQIIAVRLAAALRAVTGAMAALTRSGGGAVHARLRRRGHAEPSR